MKIDSVYLKRMTGFGGTHGELAELLIGIGIEIESFSAPGGSVLEFEITPNRPDWLSHYGVAREVAAKDRALAFTPFDLPEIAASGAVKFRVVIADPADCSRYTGAILRGIKVKESAPWLQGQLERLGMRPINNVVDISNLVMLTCGHPIHIFDLDKVEKGEIRIRRAAAGEQIVLLDGTAVRLGPEHLVIADGKKPVALAGIMGGLESGVTSATRNIFIESAHFHPPLIRRAARGLGLKTDASYRFERGMDVGNTVPALRLAVKWLAEDQGAMPDISFYADRYPRPRRPAVIRLEKTYPAASTGVDIAEADCVDVLERLGFAVAARSRHWLVTVPSFRVDVGGREDLVEEIIRIKGYDLLKSELPPTAGLAVAANEIREQEREVGRHLAALGFCEVINYVFGSPEDNSTFLEEARCIRLKNPLGRDFSQLKASLLPGLLRNAGYNLDQNQKRIMFYELGNVFFADGEPREAKRLALAVTGEYWRRDWHTPGREFDFFFFRSLADSLFKRMRWSAEWSPSGHPAFDPACCFAVTLGAETVGHAGMIAAALARVHGIERPVYAAEFDFTRLAAAAGKRYFQMWNRFPSTSRDFSFLMEKKVSFAELAAAIQDLKPPELESYLLADIYEGDKVGAGKIGLSLSFTYRGRERTLTADETNEIHGRLTAGLVSRLSLIQR